MTYIQVGVLCGLIRCSFDPDGEMMCRLDSEDAEDMES